MDVWGAILVLVRRFYLTVPLLVAGIAGGYVYGKSIPPEYHATASVVLIGPTAPANRATPAPTNPYATLGLGTVAATLELDASNVQSLSAVASAGNSTNYSVTTVGRTTILSVATTASSAPRAVSTADQVVSLIQQDLATRQAPYAPDKADQVTAQVLSGAALATSDTKARTRAEAIAIGVSVVVTILVVLIVDAVLASRRRRHRREGIGSPAIGDRPEQERTQVVRS